MGSTRVATVKLDTRDWQMEYNTSGIRTKRTSDDKTYSYIYAGDIRFDVGSNSLFHMNIQLAKAANYHLPIGILGSGLWGGMLRD